MKHSQQVEDLYIKSLDENLSDVEKGFLTKALLDDAGSAKELLVYDTIRNTLHRQEPASFGPFFAQRVVNKIMNMRVEIDRQIVFFFKKYQLAMLGVLVALIVINVVFSDQMSVPSILGIEETNSGADDILTFNLEDTLNN